MALDLTTAVEGGRATIVMEGKLTVATAPGFEAAFADLPDDERLARQFSKGGRPGRGR